MAEALKWATVKIWYCPRCCHSVEHRGFKADPEHVVKLHCGNCNADIEFKVLVTP